MVRLIAAVAVALLVAAACGGDSDTDQTAAPAGGAQLAASPGVERSEPVADAPMTDLARGWNDAGFDLWRTQPANENLVFSP
jgi:hypothetical protein